MKALIIGGTKGFGKEISDNLINNGIGVITVSRSKIHYKDHLHYEQQQMKDTIECIELFQNDMHVLVKF